MTLISFDVEASGPSPLTADIVSVGCVVVDGRFDRTFYGEAYPENPGYDLGAYKAIGITREAHEGYPQSQVELALRLKQWAVGLGPGRHVLVSDNPAFDWQWVSAIFARAVIINPFGFSARRIGDYAAGVSGDWRNTQTWKKLRVTKHTHNALDDAKGNAEALWKLMGER